jgi:hypothetical protein
MAPVGKEKPYRGNGGRHEYCLGTAAAVFIVKRRMIAS